MTRPQSAPPAGRDWAEKKKAFRNDFEARAIASGSFNSKAAITLSSKRRCEFPERAKTRHERTQHHLHAFHARGMWDAKDEVGGV